MEIFTLSKEYSIVCNSEKTRYGFRHLASLKRNGWQEVSRSKACYYNRTWEAYNFQSVVHSVISSYFSPQLAGKYKKKVDRIKLQREEKAFNLTVSVAKLGSLLFTKPEEQNGFKQRILKTIPGIDFPDDFSALPEEEKQRRLDGAIAVIS